MEVGNWLMKLQKTRVASSMAGSKWANVIRKLSFSSFQLSFTPCWLHSQSLPVVPRAAPSLHHPTLVTPVEKVHKKVSGFHWLVGHVSTSVPTPGARAKNKRSAPPHSHEQRVRKAGSQRIKVLWPREGKQMRGRWQGQVFAISTYCVADTVLCALQNPVNIP